ncbi:MAG: glutaredoxin family protein [Capsulimonadaceae bacterium]
MAEIVLYTKPGCCLCDEARRELEELRTETPFQLVECDITVDVAMRDAYEARIPVVSLNGRVIFEYFVNKTRLRELLREVKESKYANTKV